MPVEIIDIPEVDRNNKSYLTDKMTQVKKKLDRLEMTGKKCLVMQIFSEDESLDDRPDGQARQT